MQESCGENTRSDEEKRRRKIGRKQEVIAGRCGSAGRAVDVSEKQVPSYRNTEGVTVCKSQYHETKVILPICWATTSVVGYRI